MVNRVYTGAERVQRDDAHGPEQIVVPVSNFLSSLPEIFCYSVVVPMAHGPEQMYSGTERRAVLGAVMGAKMEQAASRRAIPKGLLNKNEKQKGGKGARERHFGGRRRDNWCPKGSQEGHFGHEEKRGVRVAVWCPVDCRCEEEDAEIAQQPLAHTDTNAHMHTYAYMCRLAPTCANMHM